MNPRKADLKGEFFFNSFSLSQSIDYHSIGNIINELISLGENLVKSRLAIRLMFAIFTKPCMSKIYRVFVPNPKAATFYSLLYRKIYRRLMNFNMKLIYLVL